MNNDKVENKIAKLSGILFIIIILFATLYTIIAKISYPIIEMEVLDIWYGGINNNNTRIYYAEVSYEYEGKWYSTEVEIDNDVAIGDIVKYHIDPDKPWDHNGFIRCTSIKEIIVIVSIIGLIILICIITNNYHKKKQLNKNS